MTPSAAQDVPRRGLLVYRASRLEALLDPLQHLLRAWPPDSWLAPAELICAHPGMRRWLLNQLARRAGSRGIVANLRVDLPGQWVERVSEQFGKGQQSPALSGANLHWRLFDLLTDASLVQACPSFARYLQDDPNGSRRWQLAQSLSDIFGRLLVYRPDWLLGWQAEQSPIDGFADLAAVWRRLRQRWPQTHRIDQLRQISQGLAKAHAEAIPLHVFGIAHLPPSTLDLLRAAAAQRLVVLYFPDPCREHWVGLRNDRQRLRQLLEAGADAPAELLYLSAEHPLLASLGRLGQHFAALLAGADSDVLLDIRHWQDEQTITQPATLLHQLQQSVRELDLEQIRLPPPATPAALEQDASLRIHRCHSPLRELEVLRDALLQALIDFPDLQPADIAVLAPNMDSYAPLIAAVFGPPADPTSRLPYHLADLPQASTHPLFGSFLALLKLPVQRLTSSELLALLDQPMLRRALQMEDLPRPRIEQWLRDAGIAWALDAESRQVLGLAADATHSFAWGLDRLLAGYLLGSVDQPPLIDNQLPVAAVDVSEAEALGGLYRLLAEVNRLRALASRPQPASRWIAEFRRLADELFLPGHAAEDERRALGQLLSCLGRLEQARASWPGSVTPCKKCRKAPHSCTAALAFAAWCRSAPCRFV